VCVCVDQRGLPSPAPGRAAAYWGGRPQDSGEGMVGEATADFRAHGLWYPRSNSLSSVPDHCPYHLGHDWGGVS